MCVCGQASRVEIAMIFVYGDDSSDEKRQRVAAVAVVIGTGQMWNRLEPQWVARNDGIPFHAKDCESDQGDYRGISHDQNKERYKDLATMLRLSELWGVGIAIDLAAQNEIFPGAAQLAYHKAFIEVMDRVASFAIRHGERVKFTFDISTENEYNAGLIYKGLREDNPEILQLFELEISFAQAREVPKLQVADMLAFEAMKALDNTVGPVKRSRRSWDALRETGRFEVDGYGREWFHSLKENMPELQKKVGFSQPDYVGWLRERDRQHNTSNLIHFVNWIAKRDRDMGV